MMKQENDMSERKAGGLANKIYAAVDAGFLTPREALRMLDKIADWFSETQWHKYHDYSRFYADNPSFLDEKRVKRA